MDTANTSVGTIDCGEAIQRIFDYIDEELTGARLAEFQQHIRTCHECYDHTEFERLLKARIKNLRRGNTDALKERIANILESY